MHPPTARVPALGLALCCALLPPASTADTCADAAADLPFGGVCPPSELECPPCPVTRPIKCPSGGCQADVRDCDANVRLRGRCSGGGLPGGGSTCEDVEWCHIRAGLPYACWEQGNSEHVASLSFEPQPAFEKPMACGHCLPTRSHYRCADCCSQHAVAGWASDTAAAAPYHGGPSAFMSGSRWVCLLRDVAAEMGLSNSAAGLAGTPSPPPVEVPPPPPSVLDDVAAALAFPMPPEYSLT